MNVIHYINRMEETHVIILIGGGKKARDKFQHPFIVESRKKQNDNSKTLSETQRVEKQTP